jgi:hypothetical protein
MLVLKLVFKTLCLVGLFLGYIVPVAAQDTKLEMAPPEEEEVFISVGDTLVIGSPKSAKAFAFIDIFKKTRWDPSPLPNDAFTQKYNTYDSATGNGFYRYFFRGDFDAAELPIEYQGRKYEILGLEVLKKEKDSSPINVIYLRTEDPNTVIMVDIDQAVEFLEIATVIFSETRQAP